MDGSVQSLVRVLHRTLLAILTLAAAIALTPHRAPAQVLYGSLVGHVTDPSGAAISGATVTVVNTQTDQTRQATTDVAGSYSFIDLRGGTYNRQGHPTRVPDLREKRRHGHAQLGNPRRHPRSNSAPSPKPLR